MGSLLMLHDGVVPCVIDGKPVFGTNTYEVVAPHSPTKVLHHVTAANKDVTLAAIESSAKALLSWRTTCVTERRAIFLKAAQIIGENVALYAEIEEAETTSDLAWATNEIVFAQDSLYELAGVVTLALRGSIASTADGKTAYIDRVPYGVVLGIAPWNAPVFLGLRAVSSAIIAGNTAILKTSEYSPRTHMIVADAFQKAGLPDGVLNVLHIAPKDGPSLVEFIVAHEAVQKVNFTGSTAVGRKIAEVCGRHLKCSAMELGGKAPSIVTPNADLELAANNIAVGFTLHQGQICMATNTAIVHTSVYDSFVKLLTQVTPKGRQHKGLFSIMSAQRSKALVADAVEKGATNMVSTGQGDDGRGESENGVHITILDGVKKGMDVYTEEHFSPILNLVKYETEDEAIEIANSSEYGLAASVWSKDHAVGLRLARQVSAGMVHLNGTTVYDSNQIPHGGVRKSGWGRFNGVEGIHEFTQTKVITV